MKGLNEKGIEAWNARADEIIRAVPLSEERAEEIRSKSTIATDDDIKTILREYKGK